MAGGGGGWNKNFPGRKIRNDYSERESKKSFLLKMIFVAFGGDDNLTLLVKLLEWLTSMGQSTLSTPELISGDRLINSDILKTLCVFSFCLKKDLE